MNGGALYLGLMSGTSQDGVDAALIQFRGQRFQKILATATRRYPAALRRALLDLARNRSALTLAQLAALDQSVARVFTDVGAAALRTARVPARRVAAIGSHGQTVYHQPHGTARTSVQLGDPNRIAAAIGITTVADFRRRDLALGGHGAPLVPAFHHALFAAAEPRCIVNVGGIANITLLPGRDSRRVTGFDTGPGNGLLDEWIQRHRRRPFDAGGAWGARGVVVPRLLHALLADPYFKRRAPKSTGRDYFNLEWAARRYRGLNRLAPADVQRTFAELTARGVADAIEHAARRTRRVLVCGGGVHNRLVMRRLRELLAPRAVQVTGEAGLDAQWVEAAAFAWLAMRTMNGLPGNLPAVTGARRPAILGGIYRA